MWATKFKRARQNFPNKRFEAQVRQFQFSASGLQDVQKLQPRACRNDNLDVVFATYFHDRFHKVEEAIRQDLRLRSPGVQTQEHFLPRHEGALDLTLELDPVHVVEDVHPGQLTLGELLGLGPRRVLAGCTAVSQCHAQTQTDRPTDGQRDTPTQVGPRWTLMGTKPSVLDGSSTSSREPNTPLIKESTLNVRRLHIKYDLRYIPLN